MNGGEGNDSIMGGNGKDQITGGPGIDALREGNAKDVLDALEGAPATRSMGVSARTHVGPIRETSPWGARNPDLIHRNAVFKGGVLSSSARWKRGAPWYAS